MHETGAVQLDTENIIQVHGYMKEQGTEKRIRKLENRIQNTEYRYMKCNLISNKCLTRNKSS